MSYVLMPSTKFATINLERCSVDDALTDPLLLTAGLSAHRKQFITLGKGFDDEIGNRNATAFRGANLVLMASMPSNTPTIRDEEWIELDRRVHMLFYGVLMQGVPNFWMPGIIAQGGKGVGDPIVLHVGLMPNYPRPDHVVALRIGSDVLRSADATAQGIHRIYQTKGEWTRVKLGIGALIRGWRSNSIQTAFTRWCGHSTG
jgi:hypothetical protein